MVGFEGSFISCVTAVELGRRPGPALPLGMMPSSVSAVALGGCEPPLGVTTIAEDDALDGCELPLEGCELRLDGCELRLDGCKLRLDGTGCTPGRGGRDLLAVGAVPSVLDPPVPLSPPGSRSPRSK